MAGLLAARKAVLWGLRTAAQRAYSTVVLLAVVMVDAMVALRVVLLAVVLVVSKAAWKVALLAVVMADSLVDSKAVASAD